MSDESRKDPRARIAGVRAEYDRGDDASDDEVLNVGRGGAFIATSHPLAVGKLVHLDLTVPGDAHPLAATARVVWTRELAVNDDRPAGMGVKFIDVDEGAREVIGRMVREHEATARPGAVAPARERTILGVGQPNPDTKPRQPTISGVAPEASPSSRPPPMPKTDDASPSSPAPAPAKAALAAEAKAESVAAAKAAEQRAGGTRWLLALLIAVAVAAYLQRDRILAFLK